MICNSYPYLFRKLFHKIRCTTQPVVNSTTGKIPQNLPEVQPESNLLPVSYSPMEGERKLSSLPTLYKQWLEAEIPNRQYNYDRRWEWNTSSSSYLEAQCRNKEILECVMASAHADIWECQICVHERKFGYLRLLSSELWETLLYREEVSSGKENSWCNVL